MEFNPRFNNYPVQFPIQDEEEPRSGYGGIDFDKIFNRDTSPAIEKYLNYLSQAPSREDYNPSIWQKIFAAMSGAGEGWFRGPKAGVETSMNQLDLPYNRAYQDWAAHLPQYEKPVELEQMGYKNNLEYAKLLQDEMRNRDMSGREWYNADTSRLNYDLAARTPHQFNYGGRTRLFTGSGGLQDVGESEEGLNRTASMDRLNRSFSNQKSLAGINFGYDKLMEAQRQANRQGMWNYERDNPKPIIREGENNFINVIPPSANNPSGSANVIPGARPSERAARNTRLLDENQARNQAMQDISRDYPEALEAYFDKDTKMWKKDITQDFKKFVEGYTNWLLSDRTKNRPWYDYDNDKYHPK